jgi:ABC-2 type transport system permease protein
MNATAQVLYPAPARAEMVLAVRNAAIDAERDRDATEARYREEHHDGGDRTSDRTAAGQRGINDASSRRTLAVTLAADARADTVLAEQEARVREQRRLSDRLAFLVPPALVNDAIVELAGSGHTRWDDYIARVGEFHVRWRDFFVERAKRGAALTTADYPLFPRFQSSEDRAGWFGASVLRVLVALTWVGAVAAALLVWADRRLSHTA